MKCPVCADVRMKEVDKNGVHIDVCPDCKGVWLDRGELEKLLKDVNELRQSYDASYERKEDVKYVQSDEYRYEKGYDKQYDPRYPKYKKKKSMFDVFEDMF